MSDNETMAVIDQADFDPIAALDQDFELPTASADTESASAREEIVQRQCFRLGDMGFLYRRDAAREVVAPPKTSRLPNTAPWLLGMTNIRGGLAPVVDIAQALGISRDERAEQYFLIFGHGESSIGFLIDGLPRNIQFRSDERLNGLPALPPMLRGCVSTAFEQDGTIWLELRLETLLEVLSHQAVA